MNIRDFFEEIGLVVRSVSESRGEYNIYCPFHEEKEASLFVNPTKNVYHCFGACGSSGRLQSLFYNMDKSHYKEWMYRLSMITYLPLTEVEEDDRIVVTDIEVESLPFCDENMEYMVDRSLTADTIKKFNIKFHKHHNAIVIPVYNTEGDCNIGYVRRNMEGTRYTNSPNLEVGELLYPLHYFNSLGVNKVILTEGVFDAIRAHQEGYSNTLTNMGGELTDDQIRVLGEHTTNVVLAPDKDKQGIRIAKKNIDKLQKYGFGVELAIVPGAAKDIADIKDFRRLPITSYYDLLFSKKDLSSLLY